MRIHNEFLRNADFNINCETSFYFDVFPLFPFRMLRQSFPPLPLTVISSTHLFSLRTGKTSHDAPFPFSQAHALWTHFFLKGPTPRFSESMGRSQESALPSISSPTPSFGSLLLPLSQEAQQKC